MRNDVLKTIVGLVIIGVIVVATFMYGNAQREAQQKRDNDLKAQQVAQTSPSPSGAPTTSPVATTKPVTNTAAVNSPSPNTLQGGKGTPTPTTTPQQVPATGAGAETATTAQMPQTGPETLVPALATTVVGVLLMVWRRSQRALRLAARAMRTESGN